MTTPPAPPPHPDPIDPSSIETYLRDLFPGTKVTKGTHLSGLVYILVIWQFEIRVTHTTTVRVQGEPPRTTVAFTYRPSIKDSAHRILFLKVSSDAELLDSLQRCQQYLTGIVAAIDMALTPPTKDPENTLSLFDD